MDTLDILRWITLAFAAAAAVILVWYLLAKPELTRATRLVLLLGIGVLPIASAMTGNVAGFEISKRRDFCGSCHVMDPYVTDAADPASTSLAAMHSRNDLFGDESCYVCHADYGMFGTIATKMAGMRHLYEYYTREWDEAAAREIRTYEPYPNANCMHCHSTYIAPFQETPEHASLLDELRSGKTSCIGDGCHGPPHPTAPAYESKLQEVSR